MARTKEATETTEATATNYTGVGNLKQLVLALKDTVTISDTGIAEWFESTYEAITNATVRGLPLGAKLEKAEQAINDFYESNEVPFSREQSDILSELLNKRNRLEKQIEKAESANSDETAQESE